MKLKYTKRECAWAEYKIKVPNKCTVKDLLDKLHLSQISCDVIVGGVLRSCDYMLKENDVIVLMQKESGRK